MICVTLSVLKHLMLLFKENCLCIIIIFMSKILYNITKFKFYVLLIYDYSFWGVCKIEVRLGVMVFNATFNSISVISWQSVLLVEETRVP